MTPDQARVLLGGYATGTLTAEERETLFSAALQDQSLFDELAKEQALKEALDDPAIRAELLSAVSAVASRNRTRWLWWAIPAVAAALAAVTVAIIERRPATVEIAVAPRSSQPPVAIESAPVPPPRDFRTSRPLTKAKVVAPPPPAADIDAPARIQTAPSAEQNNALPAQGGGAQAQLESSSQNANLQAQSFGAMARAGAKAEMQRADSAPAPTRPNSEVLALAYALIPVPPDSAMLRIESSAAGYVYVFRQLADESWAAIMPVGVNVRAHAAIVTDRFPANGAPVVIFLSRLPMAGLSAPGAVEKLRVSGQPDQVVVTNLTAEPK